MPKKHHIFLLIVTSCLLNLGTCMAQTSTYGRLQAAYIYNFAKYTKWPQEPVQFNIAILGETELLGDLKNTLKDKKISGKGINVNVIASADQIGESNIVYIPASRSGDLPLVLKMLENRNVLVVTEEDLARKGAAISFVVEDERLGFKVNKNVLAKAGLILSEGLLKMAIII